VIKIVAMLTKVVKPMQQKYLSIMLLFVHQEKLLSKIIGGCRDFL